MSYGEEERAIYEFDDGRGARRADPLALEDAYAEAMAGVDQAALGEQLRSPIMASRIVAEARLLPAIRAAFGVVEFDEATGEGLPLARTLELSRDLFGWKDRVRRRYRTLAQHVAAYGHDPARPLSYEAFCGLHYNLERVQAIQAVQVARGIAAALTGKPHATLVDALAASESQVPWVQLAVDAEQAEAEQLAKIGAGKIA
jgi:hypothetical protein